jgi:Signal transduction histidine kinase
MYHKLRLKIALSSIAVLLALFLGTIGIVYSTSYHETMRTEQEMLALYAEAYWKNGNPEGSESLPPRVPPGDISSAAMPQTGGQFFSVELDAERNMISIHNPDATKITNAELSALAQRIAGSGTTNGAEGSWVYRLEIANGHTLVVLLDNTLVSDSSDLLMTNTLRYGALMIVVLCAVVWFTSGLLVRPLEQNEREQRRFISDAGHELKTPVSVIAANAELLHREIGENRWLENIIAENERSSGLIQNLLTLTRMQEKETAFERVSLSEITVGVILPFEGIAFEKGHILNSDIHSGLSVQGNAQQLSSLVSILLDNAVQYSSNGSEIGITLFEESHRAVLRVQNQCPEMSPEQCRQMFDRFYRADDSRTGNGHYGLGLSIAHKIAQTHRGNISASWKDGSITFTVALPVAKICNT